MSLDVLRAELANDPAGIGYAGKTDAECLALLSAKTRTRVNAISSANLLAWAAANQRFLKLKAAAENHASEDIKNVCTIALMMLERDGTTLDLNLSDRAQMVGALVGGGVLAAEDRDALLAMATEMISRLTELGLAETHAGAIAAARGGA